MRRAGPVGIVTLCTIFVSGCTGLGRLVDFDKQLELARQAGRIDGRIDTEGEAQGTLVVALAKQPEEAGGELIGVDTFVRVRPGTFAFPAEAGSYRLGAYEDRNRNGLLDPGERVSLNRDNPVIELGTGERISQDIHLEASSASIRDPIDVFALLKRTPREQRAFSLWAWSVEGKVCEDLQAETFGPDAGPRGLWEVTDFLNAGIAGIYFMDEFDPKRIPVLFVHGMSGYPREFTKLMEALDHERYQPWFYFYPSGFSLDGISTHLATLLERLAVKHGFRRMAVVAHSVGGLVSRGAIFKYQLETRRKDVQMLVTISTPWGGDVKAKKAEDAPIELPPVFADMNPSSDYMRWLFYEKGGEGRLRSLPPQVEFHLMYGFRMSNPRPVADDGVVQLASQLRSEAQDEAATQRGFDNGHADILQEPAVAARLNRLLQQRFE